MKKISKVGAQGDVLFIRVDKLPDNVKKADDLIVAHSETGHHHVIEGDAERFTVPGMDTLSYLRAKGPLNVKHLRDCDTHETFELLYDNTEKEVIWEVRNHREYTPQGWKKVID